MTMISLFSFCKRARDVFKQRAIEDVPLSSCEDEEILSLTDTESSLSQESSWIERTCEALRRNKMNELELDSGEHAFEGDDIATISNALRASVVVNSLVLRNFEADTSEDIIKDTSTGQISQILHSNESIITLRLENSGEEAIAEVCESLAQNSSKVTSLHLKGNVICPKGARAIRDMLARNDSWLEEFSFCHNGITSEGFADLAEGLRMNQGVKWLDLLGNGIDDSAMATIGKALSFNTSVDFLCLDFNSFGYRGVQSICLMLRQNTCLRELQLFGNRIDARGATCLARALCNNSTLETLILSFNQLGDEGIVALGKALTTNVTLTKLWFPSNFVGNEGLVQFGGLLPEMKGLEELNVGDVFDTIGADAIVKGLKNNSRIRRLYMEFPVYDDFHSPIEAELDFYLRLNRCGRSLLGDCRGGSHAGLWAKVLGNASRSQSPMGSPDTLYHIIRERPDLFQKC